MQTNKAALARLSPSYENIEKQEAVNQKLEEIGKSLQEIIAPYHEARQSMSMQDIREATWDRMSVTEEMQRLNAQRLTDEITDKIGAATRPLMQTTNIEDVVKEIEDTAKFICEDYIAAGILSSVSSTVSGGRDRYGTHITIISLLMMVPSINNYIEINLNVYN